MPKQDLYDFAEAVDERFRNPYIKHALLSISLNSVSKWQARCMPSLLGYVERKGELPKYLTFSSITALMAFYTGNEIREKALIGDRDGQECSIMDEMAVLEFFATNSEKTCTDFVQAYLSNVDFHSQDLTQILGLVEAVTTYLEGIRTLGMRKALEKNFYYFDIKD